MNQGLSELIKNHILHILFIFVILFGGLYLVWSYGGGKQFLENKATLETEESNYKNIEREFAALKEANEKKQKQMEAQEQTRLENEKNKIEKPIFKTSIVAQDSFSTNAPLFEDIIRLLKASGLKLIGVENKSTGIEDSIVQNAGAMYNTCQINMQILGTYNHFQKFLTHLYDYPYLINISSMDVIPFDKDKRTLIINLSVILYSETSMDVNN